MGIEPVLAREGHIHQHEIVGAARDRRNRGVSGADELRPVTEFGEGVSAGGIHQMVGNVWEWTSGDFGYDDFDGPLLNDPCNSAVMKAIRGGAFDTYFDAQASCQFRSGDHPLSRKHNIGFRCALSACDVWMSPGDVRSAEPVATSAADEDFVEGAELQPVEVGACRPRTAPCGHVPARYGVAVGGRSQRWVKRVAPRREVA